MSWYKFPSAYAQKMSKLSCKIFQEYYYPPAPSYCLTTNNPKSMFDFRRPHEANVALIVRQAKKPLDLDVETNSNYYPGHPQIRELVHVLRKHGLFRDEHMDFVEEMKRLRILRGKRYRVKGGMTGKRAQIRAEN